ncbi:hypothetical protein BDB01DRAFT_808054 [Pilobolus umbonatus]|nr:hypothetical protein BDB01DRAFT_808054 [Pilobolus umbonatus]
MNEISFEMKAVPSINCILRSTIVNDGMKIVKPTYNEVELCKDLAPHAFVKNLI